MTATENLIIAIRCALDPERENAIADTLEAIHRAFAELADTEGSIWVGIGPSFDKISAAIDAIDTGDPDDPVTTLTTLPTMGLSWPVAVTIGDNAPQTVGHIHAGLDDAGHIHAISDLLAHTANAVHAQWHEEHPKADQ